MATVSTPVGASTLDLLFREARSVHTFRPDPVSDETIRELYELVKWGPTALNGQPARYVFVRSPQAKERLAPAMSGNNRAKTLAAPLTVIVGYDLRFFERLGTLFPFGNVAQLFASDPALAEETALRSGTLQAAYLIIAARALGLSAGPMSGFDAKRVGDTFFADRAVKANLVVNLGYFDGTAPRARGPRLAFGHVATIL